MPSPGSHIYVVLDRRLHVSDDGLATVRRLADTDIDALAIDPRGGRGPSLAAADAAAAPLRRRAHLDVGPRDPGAPAGRGRPARGR